MSSSIAEIIFIGDSEMAKLMRAHNWSATSVGRLETWSQSLKTVIRLILGSPHPMCIWWGQSMISIYNDAYAAILGQRHPQAFGQAAATVWADLWEKMSPQTKTVLREGKTSQNRDLILNTVENGELTQTSLTFSYSPLFDDDDRINGILCSVTAETHSELLSIRQQAEQQIRENEERLIFALTANRMVAWDLDLKTGITHRLGNATAILDLDTSQAEDFYQMIHPEDRSLFEEAKARVLQGKASYDLQFRLVTADGRIIWVADKARLRYDEAGKPSHLTGVCIDITEAKQREAELQDLNQQLVNRVNELQTLFDLLPIGVAISEDPECRQIRINRYLSELVRVPIEQNASHSAPPEERPSFRLYRDAQEIPIENLPMQYAASQNTEVRDEVVDLIHPDGTLIKLLCYASPLLDEQGQVRGVIGAFIDITQRVLTENALRESEERLSLAINNAGMATWDVYLKTNQVIWSQNHFTLLGYEPVASGEANNEMWRSRVHPNDLKAVLRAMKQARENNTFYRFEYRIIRADNGEIRWLREFGRFIYNEAGEAVRFIGIFFDTSDRKRAEEALKQREATIHQQLLEIETIYKSAPIGLAVLDQELRFIRINERLAEINGVSVEDHLGRTVRDIVPYLADEVEPRFRYILETGEPMLNVEISGETPADPGNRRTWIESWYPLYDDEGQIIGINAVIQDITERKRIEIALQESTALFEAFMQYSPGAAYIKDELGRYLYVNPVTERVCDRPLEQWLGKTDFELYDDVQAQEWRKHDLMAIEAGQAVEVTETLITDQETLYFLCFKFPILMPTGQQLLGGISLDVTERHHAGIALRQSEEQLRLATEAANLGMWYWDVENDQLIWTDRAKAIFGLALDTQMSMQIFLEAVHPDDREYVQSVVREMRSGQNYTEIEYRTLWPDGTVRWVVARGNSIYSDDMTLIETRGVLLDITERKRAEALIAENEAKLRGFVNANVVGMLYGDIYGNIKDANDELLRIIGYTREDLEAGRIRWTDITPPEHLPADDLGVAEARARGACTPYEKEYIRKDGSRVPVLLGYSLVGEERVESVAFILDLTERKQAERQLQQQAFELKQLNIALEQTTVKLSERNQELDRFVYTVSHDLKAPLRAIYNLSQWIADDLEGQLEDENLHQMQLLQNRVARMEALINGLLAYSRIGRTEVATERVNVSELLLEILDSLIYPATFIISIQPEMPTLLAKKLLLSQVFSNLISNAIKHHHRRDGQIKIKATPKDDYYEFSVSDDGPGIAPENHQRVFDIFQTLRGQEVAESTGIGLSIVKKIIETEGGQIFLLSNLGEGATFRFTWPKKPVGSNG